MNPARCLFYTFRQCFTNMACAPFFLGALVFYSLYYCWPYEAQLPYHLTAAIVDEDDSPLSRRLVQALRASPRLDIVQVTASRPEAVAAMRAESVVAIIGIPPQFEADALHGTPTALTLVANGAFIVKSRSTIAGASAPLQQIVSAEVAARLVENGASASSLAQTAMMAPELIVQPMYNNISGYLNFVVPIVFMIIIQTLMICGTGMLFNDWFTRGKMPDALKLALSRPIYLPAVQAPVFCITFVWTIIVEGDVFALQNINSFQNVPATVAMGAFFALAVSSLAILAGLALGRGHFVIQAVVITSLPSVFISGNLWPAQNIPACMRFIGWFIPSTPGSCGMMRASQCGADLEEIMPFAAHLGTLALIYTLLAIILAAWLRKRLFPIHQVS